MRFIRASRGSLYPIHEIASVVVNSHMFYFALLTRRPTLGTLINFDQECYAYIQKIHVIEKRKKYLAFIFFMKKNHFTLFFFPRGFYTNSSGIAAIIKMWNRGLLVQDFQQDFTILTSDLTNDRKRFCEK